MYTEFWLGDDADPPFVIPSLRWNNGIEFFEEIGMPLFDGYKVVIDHDNANCWSAGHGLTVFLGVLSMTTLLLL